MPKIAIFDSGVGGLSIYFAVSELRPDCEYFFVSDNQAFPYGIKPEEELKHRVIDVVGRIIKQSNPDCLIIACNTASTVVLPLLRSQFSLPIIGVVPAIKPASKLTTTKKIGLLATPATIGREYTNQLIQDFAADCEITKIGSSKLVQIAEHKLQSGIVDLDQIEQELLDFLANKDIDVIVLACTHFPLLNNEIERLFNVKNHPVILVDSGQAIAKRVDSIIAKDEQSRNPKNKALFTAAVDTQESGSNRFIEHLENIGFSEVSLLEE